MSRLKLLAAGVALTVSAFAHGQSSSPLVQSNVRSNYVTTSYTYANKLGQDLKLDLVIDKAVPVKGKRPIILFLFGGGWEGGARNDEGGGEIYRQFTSLGYAVVAIDYRLGIKIAKDRKEFTAANGTAMYLRAIEWSVEDVFDATAFTLKHASEWSIDPGQIVLFGGSSGATNALVAEYNVANETRLAQTHLPPNFRYAGIISMAGAFWLKAGTPLTFKNKPAPIMFFHGAKDQVVTYDEIQGPFSGYGPVAYFRKFAGPDYPKWFVDYPQGDHMIAATPLGDQMLETQAFLQKLVRERQEVSIHTVEEDKKPKSFEALFEAAKAAAARRQP
jgi:acetyl esterase/lipase